MLVGSRKVFQGELNFTPRNCFRRAKDDDFAEFLCKNNGNSKLKTPKNN
jgi:hypothetical protein